MSWASRRRALYSSGIILFFVVVLGVPLAMWLYTPATCFDGEQNQGETLVDKGGPCVLLDERTLVPHAILWSRSFQVRVPEQDSVGTYNAAAYIENPNENAGVRSVKYRFGLYDERNILVAERDGETFVMPGGITPIFEGGIDTGNREVSRTYFTFITPLVWERMANAAEVINVDNRSMNDAATTPRLSAVAKNTSVADIIGPTFVATIFDTAGNAFASSRTVLTRINANEEGDLMFTWPESFAYTVGRIDILPLLPPISLE